jgi:hypothetical protein
VNPPFDPFRWKRITPQTKAEKTKAESAMRSRRPIKKPARRA